MDVHKSSSTKVFMNGPIVHKIWGGGEGERT